MPSEQTLPQFPDLLDWKSHHEFLQVQSQVAHLTREVNALKLKCEEHRVPVQSLAPEPYDVLKEFVVIVRPTGEEEEFSARFADANLESYGANKSEAVRNLMTLLLDVFDNLCSKSPDKLGSGPRTQLAVLREFIRKRA